jgi:hypothetical protein
MASNVSDESIPTDASFSRSVRFWILLVFDVPSLTCSLHLLHCLLSKRAIRLTLNNHIIVLLLLTGLFIQIIDIPLYLNFLRLDSVYPRTLAMCIFWWYVETTMYNSTSILVAWFSFQRHILIFHDKHTSTLRKRWLFHYLPTTCLFFYPIFFYVVAMFVPTCEHTFSYDFSQPWCNLGLCFMTYRYLPTVDLFFNAILPCLLVAFFSVALLVRTVWSKHIRSHQSIRWRRYRKMTIQLLSISSIFLLFNLPFMFYYTLIDFQYIPSDVDPQIELYLNYIGYFSTLLLPFVIFLSIPNEACSHRWETWVKFVRRHRPKVHP